MAFGGKTVIKNSFRIAQAIKKYKSERTTTHIAYGEERLPAKFSALSQVRFGWTWKCSKTATSHIQTGVSSI